MQRISNEALCKYGVPFTIVEYMEFQMILKKPTTIDEECPMTK